MVARLCAEHLSNKLPQFSPSFLGEFTACSRLKIGGTGSGRPFKSCFCLSFLVLPVRIELTTSPLPRECSTTELRQPPVAVNAEARKTRRSLPYGGMRRKRASSCRRDFRLRRSRRHALNSLAMIKRGKAEKWAARGRAAFRGAARKPQAAQGASPRPLRPIARRAGICRMAMPKSGPQHPTFAAIGAGVRDGIGWGKLVTVHRPCALQHGPAGSIVALAFFGPGRAAGGNHGSHSYRRRPPPQRHDTDLGRQERHAAADDREPAHRRDADSRQCAAARRCRPAAANPRQSRRRHHGGRQAARRDRRSRPDAAHFRGPHRRHHRALRTRVQDAGEFLGDGAAGRAHGRGAGVAARRLRHRHAAGRPAHHGAGAARRQDRDRQRLCGGASAARAQGRRDRLSQGHRRRHPHRDHGGIARQRHHRDRERRARAGDRRRRRLPQQNGRAHFRRRHASASSSRASPS